MLPHEVNQLAFRGFHKVVAAGLGVSPSMVDQWARASLSAGGDGSPSPLERFIETVRVLRTAGALSADLPMEFACRELGFVPVRLGDIPACAAVVDIARPAKEFADYVHEVAVRLADQEASPDDARAIGHEIDQLMTVLAANREGLRAIENADDEQQVRARIGPRRSEPRYLRLRRAATA